MDRALNLMHEYEINKRVQKSPCWCGVDSARKSILGAVNGVCARQLVYIWNLDSRPVTVADISLNVMLNYNITKLFYDGLEQHWTVTAETNATNRQS